MKADSRRDMRARTCRVGRTTDEDDVQMIVIERQIGRGGLGDWREVERTPLTKIGDRKARMRVARQVAATIAKKNGPHREVGRWRPVERRSDKHTAVRSRALCDTLSQAPQS